MLVVCALNAWQIISVVDANGRSPPPPSDRSISQLFPSGRCRVFGCDKLPGSSQSPAFFFSGSGRREGASTDAGPPPPVIPGSAVGILPARPRSRRRVRPRRGRALAQGTRAAAPLAPAPPALQRRGRGRRDGGRHAVLGRRHGRSKIAFRGQFQPPASRPSINDNIHCVSCHSLCFPMTAPASGRPGAKIRLAAKDADRRPHRRSPPLCGGRLRRRAFGFLCFQVVVTISRSSVHAANHAIPVRSRCFERT